MLDGAQHTSITVKFSGDGTNIAASATIVFLMFSFPGLEENVLSAAGKQEMYMYSNAVHVECTCMYTCMYATIHTRQSHLCVSKRARGI